MRIVYTKFIQFKSLKLFELEWGHEVACWVLSAPFGTGKTSVLDGIIWCLKDTAPRQLANECIMTGKKFASGELHIEVDGKIFEITRVRRESGGQSLKLVSPDAVFDGDRLIEDTQRRIDAILGVEITREILESSVIGMQGQIEKFLNADPSERRDILAGLAGCEKFIDMAAKAGSMANECAKKEASKREAAASLLFGTEGIGRMQEELVELSGEITGRENDRKQLVLSLEKRESEIDALNKDLREAELAAQKLETLRAEYRKQDKAETDAKARLDAIMMFCDSRADRSGRLEREDAVFGERLAQKELDIDLLRSRLDSLAGTLAQIDSLSRDLLDMENAGKKDAIEFLRKMQEGTERIKREESDVGRIGHSELMLDEAAMKTLKVQLERRRVHGGKEIERLEDLASRTLESVSCDGTGMCVFFSESVQAKESLPAKKEELDNALAEIRKEIDALALSMSEKERALSERKAKLYEQLREHILQHNLVKEQMASAFSASTSAIRQNIAKLTNETGGVTKASLTEEIRKAELSLSDIRARRMEIASEMGGIMEALAAAREEAAKLIVLADSAEEEMLRLVAESKNIKNGDLQHVNAVVKSIAEARQNASAIKTDISYMETRIRNIRDSHSAKAERIRALTDAKERGMNMSEEADSLRDGGERWKQLQKWLRLVPHMIIERIIPAVQSEANTYLETFTSSRIGGSLQIRFPRPGDEDYPKGKREQIEIIVEDQAGSRRVRMASGGEKSWCAMALRFALSKVATGRAGSSINFMALDEAFTTLDAEGMAEVPGVIGNLAKMGHQILLISHIEEIQDLADRKVFLRKESDGTVISRIE